MSRPSPVQPFAPRLTRPIQSRHTQPECLTASQAFRRITPRLTTDLTTARLAHPCRTTAHGKGCLHCVDLRPTAELQNTSGDDDAHGDTAPQTVTFCVAPPGETSPVVDQVGALERRGDGADCQPAVAALRPARSLLLRGRRPHRVSCAWKPACLPSPYQCRL
jgi:hypothetical protein